MTSLNKALLIGRLGKDPETRFMPNGDGVCNVSIATTESWKDKTTGEKKEATEWHRVTMYRKLAEIASQYLKKGSLVYIEGALKTRKWQDQNGKDCYTTEIIADQMRMLGSKSDGQRSEPQQQYSAPPSQPVYSLLSDGLIVKLTGSQMRNYYGLAEQ